MKLEYKILWLDDSIHEFIEDRHIDKIKNFLEEEGFEAKIITINQVSDFFEKLDNSFDLILTDFHMNDMNGDEVIKKIREESNIFTEILFYTSQLDLKNTNNLDRVSFLQTTNNHHKQVIEKIKVLIGLTIRKFHDIRVMRGMIMNEVIDMDNKKLEIIKQYAKINDKSEINNLKNEIIEKISQNFSKKLSYINGNWKTKDNGFCKLIKDNFVFSSDYKIQALGWILHKLSLDNFSENYQEEIINTRNRFAHATLLQETDGDGKTLREYFKSSDNGITFDEKLCKTIRKNIRKHKTNLEKLAQELSK